MENAGDGREYSGCGRECGGRASGKIGPRRQHALLGGQRRNDYQPVASTESRLRSSARSRADCARSGDAEHPCCQQRGASEKRRGAVCAREGPARKAVICLSRRRHSPAHRRRATQEPRWRRHRPCSLSRRGPHRRDQRACDHDADEHGRDPAAGSRWQAARPCRHVAQALADHFRTANARGVRLSGLRGHLLVRAVSASRHAGRRRQQGACGHRADRRASRRARPDRAARS